ncbi:MAG: hypothetical protein FJ271_25930 [Planctomycetes bacterium]|nr:hypothetical protein [Planctomycetota bacterium]
MTVTELITSSLRRIGVVAQGNSPSGENLNDGLQVLNDFVDAMRVQRLMLYASQETTFTISANTRDYSVGSGQTVNVARPAFVTSIGEVSPVRYYNSTNSVLTWIPLPLMTDQEWRSVPNKNITNVLPTRAYYNPTIPTGTLTLWPTPTSSTLIGVLFSPIAVSEFALGDTLSLPPGYRRFLRDNLAVELATEFDLAPTSTLMTSAIESKADVERINMRLSELPIDAMWSGRGPYYNIETDS